MFFAGGSACFGNRAGRGPYPLRSTFAVAAVSAAVLFLPVAGLSGNGPDSSLPDGAQGSSAPDPAGFEFVLDPAPYYLLDLPPDSDPGAPVSEFGLRDAAWFAYPPAGRIALTFKTSPSTWRTIQNELCDGAERGISCWEDTCKEYLLPGVTAPARGLATDPFVPVVLDASSPAITGRVVDRTGKPLAEAQVTLMPREPPIRSVLAAAGEKDRPFDSGSQLAFPVDDTGLFTIPYDPVPSTAAPAASVLPDSATGPARAPGPNAGPADTPDAGTPDATPGETPAGFRPDYWEILVGAGWESTRIPVTTDILGQPARPEQPGTPEILTRESPCKWVFTPRSDVPDLEGLVAEGAARADAAAQAARARVEAEAAQSVARTLEPVTGAAGGPASQ